MIRQLLDALRCIWWRNSVKHLMLKIYDNDRAADAWPLTREVWQREVIRLQQQMDRVCGKRSGMQAVLSLLPKDRR